MNKSQGLHLSLPQGKQYYSLLYFMLRVWPPLRSDSLQSVLRFHFAFGLNRRGMSWTGCDKNNMEPRDSEKQ